MKTDACLARELIGSNTPGKKNRGRNLNEFPKGKYRVIWRKAKGGGFFPALKERKGEGGGDERTEKKERSATFLKVPCSKKKTSSDRTTSPLSLVEQGICSVLSLWIHLHIQGEDMKI